MTAPTFIRARATWGMYLALALFAYLETVVGPSVPFIREKLDLGYTATSLHFSAFAVGGIIVGFTSDRIVARFGRKRLLWGGLIGMALGAALVALAPIAPLTVTGAFFMGFLGSFALVTNQATLADIHGPMRTVAFAESNVAASTAAILAPLIVGLASSTVLGWQAGLMLGIPACAALLFLFARVPTPSAYPSQARSVGADASRLPRTFWLYWTVLLLAGSVEWCFIYWGADYLIDSAGLSKSAAATSMTLFFLAMAIGRLVGSRLARHHPSSVLLLGAFAITAIGFPAFWLSHTPMVSLAGLFVAGIGIANFYPMSISAATGVAANQPDRATARLAICGGLALLVAPFALGAIADTAGMRAGLALVPPLLLAAATTTVLARRSSAALS